MELSITSWRRKNSVYYVKYFKIFSSIEVEHILVETLLTGVGQQLTVNKQKFFSNIKDLIDFYHVQNIYSNYKLARLG